MRRRRSGSNLVLGLAIGLGILACGGSCLLVPGRSCAQVKAWEGKVTIPTYGWEEDVNPKFWALEGAVKGSTTVKGTIVYPYTMQDHLSRRKADRTYKALFLENEYLLVTCLPELGGRIHSVLDKTEGKEMFHLNRVIKPGMIAMRGAWISGGVEWNAGPQVHTVTVLSPVSALIVRDGDTAYLEISNLEKSLRTRWTARIVLHPGKAYLDETIRLSNPIDSMSPYYFWNCTAFPNRAGTRFIYPMSLGTDHNAMEFFSWPIHEGRDLSWLKNYPQWASIFAVNCPFDFFGAYDVEADRGIVQVADRHELGGKKAWTWGNWEFGLASQRNLTDEDGPYIEVQSGPLPTQSDYGMLAPRQEVSWREKWYPVHGLGNGFEYATGDVAVQTERTGEELRLRIIATSEFPAAACTIAQEGVRIAEELVDLSPRRAREVRARLKGDAPAAVTVRTREGELLAEFLTPLPIPKEEPPASDPSREKPDDQLTVEEMYLRGLKLDRATNRTQARRYYELALAKDDRFRPALRSLAVLDIEAGLYDGAAERLERGLSRKPDDDGLSWYFLGVCRLNRSAFGEALRCGYRAARCFGTAAIGHDLAGRAYMRIGRTSEAVAAFEKASHLDPRDEIARNHYLIALHAAGETDRARRGAEKAIAEHPTDVVPRALLALRGRGELDRFVRDVRGYAGEAEFEVIEASLAFAELGLAAEACRLLAAACIEAVPPADRSPLPLYYAAYYASCAGDAASRAAYLAEASRTCLDGVFPSRPEAVKVFQHAIGENPRDGQAYLHAGNLLGNLGRLDEAVSHWQRSVELNEARLAASGLDERMAAGLRASLSVARRNLGLFFWGAGGDLNRAAESYRAAIAVQPLDQTLYRDLAEILIAKGARAEAIEFLRSMPFAGVRRADVTVLLAQACLDADLDTDAIDLLEATPYFVNWEGSQVTWSIFNRAHLRRGQKRFEKGDYEGAFHDFAAAITYPANLGVGRTNSPEEALALYWKGRALEALGRGGEARAAWKAGAEGIAGSAEQNRHREMCRKALEGER